MTEGNTRAGFDLDLRKFQMNEAALGMVLMSRGTNTIEHKRDCGTIRTGNLFVEYRQPSGPSGIAATTADSWAFEYDDNSWLIIPRERLMRLCRIAYKQGRTAHGGDGNRYHGVLLPIRWLIPPYLKETS
jgi:hypothetical protein